VKIGESAQEGNEKTARAVIAGGVSKRGIVYVARSRKGRNVHEGKKEQKETPGGFGIRGQRSSEPHDARRNLERGASRSATGAISVVLKKGAL